MSVGSNNANGFSFMSPALTDSAIASFSSATEPIIRSSDPSSVLQIGRGIPQYRERDKFQSLALASQFPKRPVPVAFGFQLISWFSSYIRSLTAVALINHESSG